uniref:H15 domain-containing protein n=1 Tax=Loxodonta africana TaxID=9785 RepID=G3SRJ6_LOXAF
APQPHNPTVLCVVLEALQVGEQQQGTLVASEHYIPQKYSTASIVRLKYLLKQALANGTNQGLLMRLLNSKAREVTSGFKLFSKKKRLIHPDHRCHQKHNEAKEKDPNNPSKARKDPPDPGEVKMVVKKLGKVRSVLPKPDIANEKDPNKGGKAKAKVAKVSEAKKVLPINQRRPKRTLPVLLGSAGSQCSKAAPAAKPLFQKMLRVPRNANTGSKNSKAKVTKQQEDSNLAKVPKEAAAQGAGKELKAKATAVLKGKGSSGSKTVPVDLAKTEAPKDPRRPGLAAKASLSKASIKKAKVKS